MTYYGGKELAASFRTVRQNTIQIAEKIPETSFPELLGKLGAEEGKPRSKAELIAFLKTEGEKFATYLEGLPEAFLGEPVGMPPGAQPATKNRLEMLLSAKEHEMHHRGQLMMIPRMLGLTPHLTRQMQERFAQSQAAQEQAHR